MVAISGISFGALSVFSRQLSQAGFSVPQMLFLRFAGGAAVMWGLTFARKETATLAPKQLGVFSCLGALYVLEAFFYFESSLRIPIGLTALLLYLYPSLVIVANWALFRQSPGWPGALGVALATSGIVLAVGTPSDAVNGAGVALGAATAVVYTVYVLLGARFQPGVPPLLSSAIVMTVAASGFLLATLTGKPFETQAFSAWPALAGLVIIGTTIPIPLLLFGMSRIGANQASIVSTLEPISAMVCGWCFLGETLSVVQWVGAALVLAAIAASANQGSSPIQKAAPMARREASPSDT
jgi:drug/metabolite transporter (DMT)-like permease